jgi:DNA-binding XRE family transcriptional regulator
MKPPAKQSALQYRHAFLARTAQARERAKYTQAEIAEILDITQDTYKQYEKRTPLPHYLIPRFCLATKTDPAVLFGMPGAKGSTNEHRPKHMAKRA